MIARYTLAIFLSVIVILSIFAPILVQTAPYGKCLKVPSYIERYLLEGECVVDIREYNFAGEEVVVYRTSTDNLIVYSKNRGMVVWGWEWLSLRDAEDAAMELLSMIAYKEGLITLEAFDAQEYADLVAWADEGVEIGRDLANREIGFIGVIVPLALGIVLLVVVPPKGAIALAVFLLGYTASLSSTLYDFLKNFEVNEKNSPFLLYALSMVPYRDQEAYRNFEKALSELRNPWAVSTLKSISTTTSFLSLSFRFKDVTGGYFLLGYTLASKDPELMSEIENTIGSDLLNKVGDFLIFKGEKGAFSKYKAILQSVWNRQKDPSELSKFIFQRSAIKGLIIGAIVSYIREAIITAGREKRMVIGFHTTHTLLIRELAFDLYNALNAIGRGDLSPSLRNIQSLIYYDYLLRILLYEYYKGLRILPDNVIEDMYKELLEYWNAPPRSTANWVGELKGEWEKLAALHSSAARRDLKLITLFTCKFLDFYLKYKEIMKKRREKAGGGTAGINVFLVMDVSGSMENEFMGARKIDAAKKAAKDFVSLISPIDKVGLIAFSTYAYLVSDLTSNKSILYTNIESLTPSGETALGDAIMLAIDRLVNVVRQGKIAAIIVLTDGKHNAGQYEPLYAANRAKTWGIPVYTLGYGEKEDIDEEMLKKIASITDARYFFSPSPDNLRELYIMLTREIAGEKAEVYAFDTIGQGEVKTQAQEIPPGTPYIRASLSYDEGNLTLALVSPGGTIYRGYEENATIVKGRNFVELLVFNPQPGRWQIEVKGISVPQPHTEFRILLSRPNITVNATFISVELGTEVLEKAIEVFTSGNISQINFTLIGDITKVASISSINQAEKGRYRIVLRFMQPKDTIKEAYIGALKIRSLASVAYVPIYAALQKLMVTPLVEYAREGEALNLKVAVYDRKGNPVEGAEVTVNILGSTVHCKELGDGIYQAMLSGLKEGEYEVIISASKPGYVADSAITTVKIGPSLLKVIFEVLDAYFEQTESKYLGRIPTIQDIFRLLDGYFRT